MENSCNFVGFVKRMSDLKESKSNNHYLKFTLDNPVRNYHNYIPVVAFRSIAEEFDKEISEGDFIAVNTSLNINNYDGQTRYSFTLNDFHVIDVSSQASNTDEVKRENINEEQKQEREENVSTETNKNNEQHRIISSDDLKRAYEDTIGNEKKVVGQAKEEKTETKSMISSSTTTPANRSTLAGQSSDETDNGSSFFGNSNGENDPNDFFNNFDKQN